MGTLTELGRLKHKLAIRKMQAGLLEKAIMDRLTQDTKERMLKNRASVRQARYLKLSKKTPAFYMGGDKRRFMKMKLYEPSSTEFDIGDTGYRVVLAYRIVEVYQGEHEKPKHLPEAPKAVLSVACSFCSPKDRAEGFSSLKGREDAIERLEKGMGVTITLRMSSMYVNDDLVDKWIRTVAGLGGTARAKIGIPTRMNRRLDRVKKSHN